MTIIEDLNAQMKAAMKNRAETRLGVLRMLKAKLLEVDARGAVPTTQAHKIFKKYAKSLKESLAQQAQYGRSAEVAQTKEELAIVQEFLPAEMTDNELETIVRTAVSQSAAASLADMGQVMKTIMGTHQNLDGNRVQDIARKILT